MSYQAALEYLDSFINYEKKTSYSYKESLKLERIKGFLGSIGNPQDSFSSIHVAGTKGKGSVCAMCASVLREAGYSTGLYTSPHLSDVRERIRILTPGNKAAPGDYFEGMIPPEELERLVRRLQPAIDEHSSSSQYGPLSFFELYTALAFVYFRERGVDIAVLETGMGGRLDATNVVRPLVCGITAISLDHMNKLGATLPEIAAEKAGIIKEGIPVISVEQAPEVNTVLREQARSHQAMFLQVGKEILSQPGAANAREQECSIRGPWGDIGKVTIPLIGRHQCMNAALAVALAQQSGLSIDPDAVRRGFKQCRWPGRFELVRDNPVVILDGAHNQASAEALSKTLNEVFAKKKIILVIGVSADKDAPAICAALVPQAEFVIATQADNPRAIPCAKIAEIARSVDPGARVSSSSSVREALSAALRQAAVAVVVVTGSLFVVGEAREVFKGPGR